jgi:hypothetical protein
VPKFRSQEDLFEYAEEMGIHPAAVSRRIATRMPHALDPFSAVTKEQVDVVSAYNTKWKYLIVKAPDGGYYAEFRPAQARTSGSMGGYLTESGIIGKRTVFPTKKAAYMTILKHGKKGGYLLHKNPSDAMEREVVRLGNLLDDYSGGESGDLDYIFGSAPVADRLDAAVAACQEYRVPAKELRAARKMLGLKSNPRDWSLAYEGRLRDMSRASDGLTRVRMNPRHAEAMRVKALRDLMEKGYSRRRIKQAGLPRVPSSMMEKTPFGFSPMEGEYYEGLEETFNEALGKYARAGGKAGFVKRWHPEEMDAQYLVGAKEVRGAKGGKFYPVTRNPKRAKYVSAQAAGLARGQSLMAQAAEAYHAGKYPNMAMALKGVSGKGRR